jgi:preprotein translocase subunit YajC
VSILAFDLSRVAPFLAQAEAPQGPGIVGMLLPLGLVFLVFYFLLIRPQQVRQKKWNEILTTLKAGDKVTTAGGVRGVIIAVKDDAFHLRVPPDNLRLEVTKQSVVTVNRDDEKGTSQS